ncbi:UDP-N-acetylmuramoyl-L-alanine--D-glutamate ligase [Saxibacter everestensis]|uniref:UDP-N-acetylmuramoylalanine--D-glutamate ligase n=1 Tax=Saxibacter everestensis TaxID=2909229 RepID=A0ABY8QYQ0_9MICO|nr:UDP-N-acetylmuramoyl-L-alanine--D-glutamate ligase [Brevibacteriaceae bacterium ZFBP1038]
MGCRPVTESPRLARINGKTGGLDGLNIVVTGLGVSGFPAAVHLAERGASVIVVDSSSAEKFEDKINILSVFDAEVRLGPDAVLELPRFADALPDLVITSPGWRPDQPLLAQAAANAVPIWGEVELAWRLRGDNPAPWLVVTGTNGKTTVTSMLESMLQAAGLRALAAGNIGTPLVEAVLDDSYEVLAVELSSFQLHWIHSMSAHSAVVLNIADDHADWHGSVDAYVADKARIYQRVQKAGIYNEDDPRTRKMLEEADVVEGARAIGVTLAIPAPSQLGLVEDVLCDRAFIAERRTSAAELGNVSDVAHASGLPDDAEVPAHQIFNALAAAALARSFGVPGGAIRDGLRSFTPGDHRIQTVAEADGVRWVNDSKATNPHAALASLGSLRNIVWIAGGLAKGAKYDDLVGQVADRLKAVVLIGVDTDPLSEALSRHAPDVPLVVVPHDETGTKNATKRGENVMADAVRAAAQLSQSGDTVILAPAAASMDQFDSYATRGDLFRDYARRHAEQ